jgi:hypothetical protein
VISDASIQTAPFRLSTGERISSSYRMARWALFKVLYIYR